MKTTSYVYWLHLPEHTDITSQGYIGVCRSNRLNRRLYEHKDHTRNIHLKRALKKYPDVRMKVLVEASSEYCFELEHKLRPSPCIGWNRAPGGIGGNGKTGTRKGAILTDETKAKISKSVKERGLQTFLGRNHTDETKAKISAAKRGVPINRKSASHYIITHPNGTEEVINNITRFCKEHNLHKSALYGVANGQYKQYKGFTCKRLDKE